MNDAQAWPKRRAMAISQSIVDHHKGATDV